MYTILKRMARYCFLLFVLALAVACAGDGGVAPIPTRALAVATIGPPTATLRVIPTVIPTAAPTVPRPASPTPRSTAAANVAVAGSCEIVAPGDVTVYQRPSREAAVFGALDQAFRPEAVSLTPDGAWVGFEPGVAQAANVGVFRLRWVAREDVSLEGACAGLDEVVGPPAGVCFAMPMQAVSVFADPDASSTLVGELAPGTYAAVTAEPANGWARVDLEMGENRLAGTGWIRAETLNLNGPCTEFAPAD